MDEEQKENSVQEQPELKENSSDNSAEKAGIPDSNNAKIINTEIVNTEIPQPEVSPAPGQENAGQPPAAAQPLTKEGQKVLFEKLESYKREVTGLRNRLNSLNDRKEAAYRKKEAVTNEILLLISEIKKTKTERDVFTKQVKESKEKRTELNREITSKIEEIKKLNREKRSVLEKYHLEGDPALLKKEIDGLEFRVETEAFSPSEEKKLMKLIKEKKKLYNELKGVSTIFDKTYELSNEIEKLKKKADDAHKKLRSKADTSQEKHEALVETSKEIDELRKKEKEASDAFFSLKKEFTEINNSLKQKLSEMNEINIKVGKIQKEKAEYRKKERTKTLDEKKKIVEEKLSTGKKLTTEDIIAMQG